MTSREHWREIQEAISAVEDEQDVEDVRRMIEELDQDDPDRADLGHQLARIESGLKYRGGTDAKHSR